jgi:transcriptional regulator with XRE-family HTH domain
MRESRGWTQTMLAERLGTTQNAISRLENPKSSPATIPTLRRIAETFDVALIVKFAPFSEFVDSLSNMTERSVSVPAYDSETEKQERAAQKQVFDWSNIHCGSIPYVGTFTKQIACDWPSPYGEALFGTALAGQVEITQGAQLTTTAGTAEIRSDLLPDFIQMLRKEPRKATTPQQIPPPLTTTEMRYIRGGVGS